MNDQLERELEQFLARTATDAVPDARRVLAPPWREQERRSRIADVRRFGRATPWLVAAVLLVIAGLGIGAAVTFDAAPSDRAPVGTEGPNPWPVVSSDASVTASNGPTPTSHPTLSRDADSSGPDDGVDTNGTVINVGSYGPVAVRMTQAEALAALGLGAGSVQPGANSCFREIPLPGGAIDNVPPRVLISTATDRVVYIFPAAGAVDSGGHGVGTTLAELRAAYPDGQLSDSVSGWVFYRLGSIDAGTGYVMSTGGLATPADGDTVTTMIIGTQDFARGAELYCGS